MNRRVIFRLRVRALWLLLLLWPGLRAWAVQATLIADAHVSAAQPNVNAGGLSNLNVGNGFTTLVQFDLGVLPVGVTAPQITRATLRLFCNRADTPGSVALQSVNGAWTESGVTYANLPALGSSSSSANVTTAGAFVTFDVTSLVQGWVNQPGTNFGVALSSSSAAVQFDSKENDETSHLPQLEIVLATGTGSSGDGVTGATGPMGATGVQGPAGATGASGLPGTTGATGATGAAGAGLLNYLGSYSSTHNYANGDVVEFSGSTWISQIDGNHGNTPGFATGWGLLASVGATGATGAVGVTGSTGQQGSPGFGIQGVTGATGATGTPGAKGTPGLVYQGAYNSVTSYATGDVVLWTGSSYASLIDDNHGNTPGLVPGTWGVLTAQGPIGLTGATGAIGAMGATGSLGPVGPPGEKGDQGSQGIAGQAGAQGLPGVTGATGVQGPMGPSGVAGPVGMSFQGAYSSGTNYSLGQGVLWQGAGWVSLAENNHGNVPDASPAFWAMFAAQGSVGATGATGTGLAGATGSTGATGVAGNPGAVGITGATGAAGLNFTGAYSATTSYSAGDAVSYAGSSYVSLAGNNHGQVPDQSPAFWSVLAGQGVQGPAGPSGPAGVAGATGVAGPQGNPGVVGPTGAVGAAGAPGINFRGAWSPSATYQTNDAATFGGSTYLALSQNRNQEPDGTPQLWAVLAEAGANGSPGASGATGAAATITVGSVTTLPSGSQATVTNSGSAAAAVLNFGIPQGAAGSGSAGSGTSSANPITVAVYHSVTYTTFGSIDSPNVSSNETAAVLAWVPRGCTASRLDVYSQQAALITVTVRIGTPGNMTGTALSCSASTGGSCSSTGTVNVVAGEFVDLEITGASGAAAGVWTAVECDLTQ